MRALSDHQGVDDDAWRQREAAWVETCSIFPLDHPASAIVSQVGAEVLAHAIGSKSLPDSVRDLTPEIPRQI